MQDSTGTLPPITQSGFLVQNSGAISGSMMLNDAPCSSVGSVGGTLTGTAVSLIENPTGLAVSLDGTLGSDQTTMSGNYTFKGGTRLAVKDPVCGADSEALHPIERLPAPSNRASPAQ
jgi:hypothetical protein